MEPIILSFEEGPKFIDTINNGFSGKIAEAELLQDMYETQRSNGKYIEPVELVETIGELIEAIDMKELNFDQKGKTPFRKKSVPKKQVMALYAINKICSIANGEKK